MARDDDSDTARELAVANAMLAALHAELEGWRAEHSIQYEPETLDEWKARYVEESS